MAGIYASTDRERGVQTAPAGVQASMAGVVDLAVNLTDTQNGLINPLGLNALRVFPIYGAVPWGARTLQGADSLGSDWKYIPVRRLALYIEESLVRGLAWTVFEPNGEQLWTSIRHRVESFMTGLWRQGALLGATSEDGYLRQMHSTTTSAADIEAGILNLLIGFAAVRPAEFLVLRIQLRTNTAGA